VPSEAAETGAEAPNAQTPEADALSPVLGGGREPGVAIRRGTLVHKLLQILPDIGTEDREARARLFLDVAGAFLPEDERETVIAYNLPRLKDFHLYDEVFLRSEVENVRRLGYAGRNTGALPGMAGLAVPILDRNGRAVAALSVATISDRLGPDRLMTVVELLKREATAISARINPFDPSLRRPSQVFGQVE